MWLSCSPEEPVLDSRSAARKGFAALLWRERNKPFRAGFACTPMISFAWHLFRQGKNGFAKYVLCRTHQKDFPPVLCFTLQNAGGARRFLSLSCFAAKLSLSGRETYEGGVVDIVGRVAPHRVRHILSWLPAQTFVSGVFICPLSEL